MKTTLLKISFIFLLLSLMGSGCDKEEEEEDSITELPIFKELPILYIGYNLENEETLVIKNQETLEIVFSKDLIAQITALQNIDFSKYDVLAGQNSTPSGFAKLKHEFIKLENYSYLYKLDVSYEIVGVPMNFYYGIIVNKLPIEAIVKFEVNKINP
ncbi:MAG: hypothetical protein Q8P34_10855 [Bacteroidota bacterium]|nr:hypothetical protein [Bacteroidota bacterium]